MVLVSYSQDDHVQCKS